MAVLNYLNFYILIILFLNVQLLFCHALKETNLETCKIYQSPTQYNFTDYFQVNKRNNKITANERLHLKFYVIADMTARLLLTEKRNETSIYDRIYEIEIGHLLHTSYLRRYLKESSSVDFAFNWDFNVKSLYEPAPVEIIQNKVGDIMVYAYTNEPILKYTDQDPLDINYVSFGSSHFENVLGTPHKWFYSCQFDGFGSEFIEESEIEEPCECLNGYCPTSGICTCPAGFALSELNRNVCDPVCLDSCPNGFCSSPNQCTCESGYSLSDNNKCEPDSGTCINGTWLAAGICICDDGYYMSKPNECKPFCEGGCNNGYCEMPGICGCNNGYTYVKNKCRALPS